MLTKVLQLHVSNCMSLVCICRNTALRFAINIYCLRLEIEKVRRQNATHAKTLNYLGSPSVGGGKRFN